MIQQLVAASLRARVLVVGLAVALLVAGFVAARNAPVDAFPEFAPPLVEVQTEAPGLSSLEVEQWVTTPLEQSLAGTSFSTHVRSRSVLGLSSVVVLFEPATDLFVARQLVQERVTRARALLPATASSPTLIAPISSTSRMLKIGLTSQTLSQTDLSELCEWTIRPRLLAIDGVANVAVWGARTREYAVRLDPVRLEAAAVGLEDAVRALRAALQPLAGGYLDGALQRVPVRHVIGDPSPASIADLPVVLGSGSVVRVRDIATVEDTHAPPIGDAVVNDEPGLLLVIEKQPWGNTQRITERIDEALAELKPSLPGVEIDSSIFRPASFIQRSIANLERALLLGCALVVAVLFLFLWSWRTALISALAIPLSLGAAILVLYAAGATINTMILAGLVIALGEVVDDAIIDVENILRRLRENARAETPRSAFQVALEASLEVRSAVVYATAIVILVFLPVWFLEGVSGAFFRPLALAYGLGVLASLAVALTVTPALALLLLPRALPRDRRSPILVWLERRYERLLPSALDRPRLSIGIGLTSIAACLVGLYRLEGALLPEFRENDFLMHWVAQPGTSLEALRRTTARISPELRAIPGVQSFGAHLGRAEAADEVVGTNFGELWVHVRDDADPEHTAQEIRQTIARYPGLRRDLETYLRERIDEVISGTSGSIVVRVSGPELEVLRRVATELGGRLRGIEGVDGVRVEQQASIPELLVEPKPEATALGFLAGDVRRAVSVLVQGERVGELIREGRPVPVLVRGPAMAREDASALADTVVQSASGARARLRDVAFLTLSPTPSSVPHDGGLRRIDVAITAHGGLEAVVAGVQRALDDTPLPAAHQVEVLGEWRERERTQQRLLWTSAAALALVLLILYSDQGSWKRTAIVGASLPFAMVGGVAGAWLSGGVLSLGSLVGLVTVVGIASRNGILLISHYRHLEADGMPFGRDLVLRGTVERLGPIVMTSLATSLALVPLVIAGNRPGHEIEHPMAVVILGGLVSSTLMNLIILPAVYARYGRSSSSCSPVLVGAESADGSLHAREA